MNVHVEAEAPPVTVVVPTRDRPELLRQTVDSILAQDYPGDIECLVVFDQSKPDHSLCRSTPRRRVEVLENTRTPGLPGARNTGISAATGDFVAFCDDDDLWLPDRLSAQVAVSGDHPDVDVFSCGIRIMFENRTFDRLVPFERVSYGNFLRSRVMEVHSSTILVRAEALHSGRIGLVDEELPGDIGEDYEWLLRASRETDVIAVPLPLVVVRWHSGSWYVGHWEAYARGLQYVLRRHPDLQRDRRGAAHLYGQLAIAYAATRQWRPAWTWIRRAVARYPFQPRAYLALAVGARVVDVDTLSRVIRRRGRGL